jgi:hypothetical protein
MLRFILIINMYYLQLQHQIAIHHFPRLIRFEEIAKLNCLAIINY